MKQILAVVIDFFVGIIGTAWILSRLQGAEMTFSLYDIWLIIWIVSIIAYFVVAKKVWVEKFSRSSPKNKLTVKLFSFLNSSYPSGGQKTYTS